VRIRRCLVRGGLVRACLKRGGLVRPMLLGGLIAAAAVAVPVTLAGPAAATAAAQTPAPSHARHVVIVGISGLRWSDVSQAATPTLWRLAGDGSVGSLVDYAVQPLTCPADAWLTLNAGARAQTDHSGAGCGTFPAVVPAGRGALVPGLPGLAGYNRQFHYDPDWGLLGRSAGCATAVGPGAALALAGPSGRVASYLPAASDLSAAALSRCPLTVVDLGNLGSAERSVALAAADHELARLVAELPSGTTLLVIAPGATAGPPHLQVALADGPGYGAGLLESSSTRQSGLVVLTDLTPTVLGWLGDVPSGLVGAQLTRGARGPLGSAVQMLDSQDTAAQVWQSTHGPFFWAYALAGACALAAIGLASWGASPERRRRRALGWRVAGVFAASVPVGTFLANLVPWSRSAHPAVVLYGTAVALAAVIGLAALLVAGLAGRLAERPAARLAERPAARLAGWRDPFAPFGLVCLLTVAVLGIDVMTGSRLQLEVPFGLSVLEAGRYYGIGNEALGVYGVAALLAAAWLALVALRRYPSSRRPAVLAVAAVGVFAVFASGWPGFGGKVGGTIAMVPCFILLAAAVAGAGAGGAGGAGGPRGPRGPRGFRLGWRWVALVAVSGVVLFAVFALIAYFVPVTGKSDIGAFAGDVLHGHAGGVLARKIGSNVGSLSVSPFSPVIPVVAAVTGLMLWRPSWFGLKTVPLAYAAWPLLRPVLAVAWLMPVLGWFADDSGVIVPASVLPMALPLGIALLAAAAYGSSRVTGQEGTQGVRAVPAIAHRRRPVPAHDLAAEGDRSRERPALGRGDPGR
jgi:hypothetical protein